MRISNSAFVDQLRLGAGQAALVFLPQDGKHVNALARAHQVDLGLLARLGRTAKLQNRSHVDGMYDLLEAHRGRMLHAWVGSAHGGVQVVGGLFDRRCWPAPSRWQTVGRQIWVRLDDSGPAKTGGAGGSVTGACGDLNSIGGAGVAGVADAAAGIPALYLRLGGWIGRSGRGVPSRVNLRRSVTTNGLFWFSDMISTLFGWFGFPCGAATRCAQYSGRNTGGPPPSPFHCAQGPGKDDGKNYQIGTSKGNAIGVAAPPG